MKGFLISSQQRQFSGSGQDIMMTPEQFQEPLEVTDYK
jgi:hypothetical protein